MDNEDPKPEEVNEPGTSYNTPKNNTIRFHSSYKGQEDEMIAYWASITPIQRLAHLHEMIIASYGLTEEQLANPVLRSDITFRKLEL